MACRGVFFAISNDQADALSKVARDDRAVMALIEAIEEAWDTEHLAECDKAWDAIHRLLTDGRLEDGNGTYPLSHCVLGPRQLHEGDGYIVSLVAPNEVRDVAAALQAITQPWFEERYRTIVPKDYAREYSDEDLHYTWDWFQGVRELYAKAAAEQKAVIFTVDQ